MTELTIQIVLTLQQDRPNREVVDHIIRHLTREAERWGDASACLMMQLDKSE